MNVADTNHLDMLRCLRQSLWQVRDKPVCVALMEFSLLQRTGKVSDKVHGLSRGHKSRKSLTWFMSRTFMICHELCRKVCLMEFGFKWWQGRIALIGQSAGAHLAALTVLELSMKHLSDATISDMSETDRRRVDSLQVSFVDTSTFSAANDELRMHERHFSGDSGSCQYCLFCASYFY